MKLLLILIAVVVALSYVPLLKDKALRKGYSDLLFYQFISFLLVLKGSIILFDIPEFINSPLLVLYKMGNLPHWILAFIGIGAITIYFRNLLSKRMLISYVILFVGIASIIGASTAINREEVVSTDKTIVLYAMDGEAVDYEDLISSQDTVILNFWASWCPPCKAEIPELNIYNEDWPGQLLAINVSQTEKDNKQFTEIADQIGYPIYRDVTGALSALYNVETLPTTIIIKDNRAIRFEGVVSYDWLKYNSK
ncbi:TlpA family protein disulfide reductase [Spirochaeta cellobiosiphila]|uniref:TlpA family protein disulfide reductase n=1 Tax=Spirochaeta cellobiosiphila TaxID=504483 RepID=UPI00041092E7|nr:TlpA disulfide reductase family protein [Spirochaeta cellobiosiphila]